MKSEQDIKKEIQKQEKELDELRENYLEGELDETRFFDNVLRITSKINALIWVLDAVNTEL